MRLVCISDTHTDHARLVLPPGDALLHGGDWSLRGSRREVLAGLDWMAAAPHRHKILIAGNHDRCFERYPSELAAACAARGLHLLSDTGLLLDGVRFWGSPVTPRFYDWAFNRDRGPAIRAHWDLIPPDTDVLITHGPPAGVLDWVPRARQNVGCVDLWEVVQRVRPQVHLFGHIHEAYGVKEIDGICFVNASVADRHDPLVVEVKGIEA